MADVLSDHSIAIIGAGNIGRSLIGGLLRGHDVDPARIHATRRNVEPLREQFRDIKIGSDNAAAVADATIVGWRSSLRTRAPCWRRFAGSFPPQPWSSRSWPA